jgi:phosphotransferase system enzyme I (PtsI)
MTFSIHGVGVSRGIAMGKVHILDRGQVEISEYAIPLEHVEAEVSRLETALYLARQQLRAVRDHIPAETAADIGAFIDTHLLMLEDTSLTLEPARIIRDQRCNAEWALKLQHDALIAVFEEMDDPYLKARKNDVDHVVQRIQRILLNQGPLRHELADDRLGAYIVIADDLTPADTVLMRHHGIIAFATEYGGPTSHTAILARSLGIPSIVGLHQARRYLRDDEMVIVDGGRGVLIVDPDERILEQYRRVTEEVRRYYQDLIHVRAAPTVTLDGVPIELNANVELPSEFKTIKQIGAAGVGLYRTEFLFMNREAMPDEGEHYQSYRQLIEMAGGVPVTIRTLDIGADKQVNGAGGGRLDGSMAANPALGLRSIRLCLKQPSLFIPQLRAIMRVSALGPVRMMVPMLSNLEELAQVMEMIQDIRAEFRHTGVAFDEEMPIGGMIEVPAAAICADAFAKQLDFLSIGTNDLIQYTMAIDRVNDEVNYLYDPLNPGVLRLIRMTIEAGRRFDTPVAMCGEMAGDTRYVRLLLGMGLRQFSVHVSTFLEVKRIIIESRIADLEPRIMRTLESGNGADIRALVEDLNRTNRAAAY